MQEGVNNRNDDKMKNDEEKEAESSDENSPFNGINV